jgi:hypothetical protein
MPMGCFSEWLGKILNMRSAKPILLESFSVRHGEKQEEQSSQNMFLLYGVVQMLQAVSCT